MAAASARGLIDDGAGTLFEHCGSEEAAFLYEEIFVRQSYLANGVALPLHAGATVVDLGANIGLFSLHALRANPRLNIVAVEPCPAAFAALERNLSSAPHARCVRAAVRDAAGTATLTCFPGETGESTCHPRERRAQRARLRAAAAASGWCDGDGDGDSDGEEVVEVEAVGLPQLLERLGVRGPIDLLKVDVEGDELRVLLGLGRDLRRIRQVSMEVHDVYGRLARCVALLRRHGFSVTTEQQRGDREGEGVRGYHMFVPETLGLFYVYAVRPSAPLREEPSPRPSKRKRKARGAGEAARDRERESNSRERAHHRHHEGRT